MGKRTNFEKNERDYYPTPISAVRPVVRFLLGSTYAEPCVGGGHLVQGISHQTFRLLDRPICKWASDLQPDTDELAVRTPTLDYRTMDALHVNSDHLKGIDFIVTNPPFSWPVLSKLLPHWIDLKPTWLLLPSDMSNNVRFSPFMAQCSDFIPIGRVSWMGNDQSGMENYAWYCFDAGWHKGYARQWPR